jgi:hypothetical protein
LAAAAGICLLQNIEISLDNQWIVIVGLFLVGILRGLFFKSFKRKTDYFGHLATVYLIVSIVFSCVGMNPVTALLVPFLGVHIWTKRLQLL